MFVKKHKFEKMDKMELLETVCRLAKEQGLVEEVYFDKEILGRKIVTAKFKLGFEFKLWIEKADKKVFITAGNTQLGSDATIHYEKPFDEIRTDTIENTFKDLELDMIFCRVLRKGNGVKNWKKYEQV